ncbi:hypothetical protein L21TH_0342 [Caldisalinibacter kiritimatiensis]|uniref:Uncharacterized protein n=1 Tax=Caldisalinibacter kiritimatiensis TaxID=1304284 RepID=R1AWN8_9FIRM|nr:DUF6648 family protein [Caldisalinibacter kiritimatiensis]EOD01603.1 hypothetical protein L21TH_0342 [Caldisalinibacter kiritimatiensis]
MVYTKNENIFDSFFMNRDFLIMQFKNGDINKREFLQLNFDYIQKMKLKPFDRIDSFEKGIYNYQYYNMLAKYYYMMAMDIKKQRKHLSYYRLYLDECKYYYNEKDKSTFRLLKHLNYENVEAYYIKVKSKKLMNKLYEIVLKDYEYAIFHSKSVWLLNVLKKEGLFKEGIRTSLIDDYINEKY